MTEDMKVKVYEEVNKHFFVKVGLQRPYVQDKVAIYQRADRKFVEVASEVLEKFILDICANKYELLPTKIGLTRLANQWKLGASANWELPS